jgi:hypothetical protein
MGQAAALAFERRRDYVRARQFQARKPDNSGTLYPTQGATSQLPRHGSPIRLPRPRQRRRQLARPVDQKRLLDLDLFFGNVCGRRANASSYLL